MRAIGREGRDADFADEDVGALRAKFEDVIDPGGAVAEGGLGDDVEGFERGDGVAFGGGEGAGGEEGQQCGEGDDREERADGRREGPARSCGLERRHFGSIRAKSKNRREILRRCAPLDDGQRRAGGWLRFVAAIRAGGWVPGRENAKSVED